MKIIYIEEMAKVASEKTCGKCGQIIAPGDPQFYYAAKKEYRHKGGCPIDKAASSVTPTQPSTAPTSILGTAASAISPVQQASAPEQQPAAVQPVAPAAIPKTKQKTAAPASATVQISAWLKKHKIENFTIDPETNVVNVTGHVELDIEDITELPVQFGEVTGKFDCGAMGLTTLKGCPHTVGGSFDCSSTDITSFEHGPTKVGGSYFAMGLGKPATEATSTQAASPGVSISLQGLPNVIPRLLSLDSQTNFTNFEGVNIESVGELHLPSSKWSGHNIHKHIKKIINGVTFAAGAEKESSHWLGFLLIDGLRDGFTVNNKAVKEMFNGALETIRGVKAPDPAAEQKEVYRDVLAVQEALIDAGFSRLGRL